jgi:hypothetical protein
MRRSISVLITKWSTLPLIHSMTKSFKKEDLILDSEHLASTELVTCQLQVSTKVNSAQRKWITSTCFLQTSIANGKLPNLAKKFLSLALYLISTLRNHRKILKIQVQLRS